MSEHQFALPGRALQCGAVVVACVRRPDRTGETFDVCDGHVPWARAQVGIPAKVVRTDDITSRCVAPRSVPTA